MTSFSECEVVEAQMPFYLSVTCLVVKMLLTVLVFGPETVQPSETRQQKTVGKWILIFFPQTLVDFKLDNFRCRFFLVTLI